MFLIMFRDSQRIVPAKAKGRGKRNHDFNKPLSGLDIETLLASPSQKRIKISAENAIPEYKQALPGFDIEDPSKIHDVAKAATDQMGAITRSIIASSTGTNDYSRAIAQIEVMREELLNLEELTIYDNFIRNLKQKLLAGELGGNRREFFWEVKKHKLGLITKESNENSDVTEEEAREFYKMGNNLPLR